MSQGISYLHSHSGLERNVNDPDITNKSHVLIDEKYLYYFPDIASFAKKVVYNNITYCKIPIMKFVMKGGRFKNLEY
jgi:hypothetical protein